MTADLAIVPEAVIERMSFEDAAALAGHGAEVLHPTRSARAARGHRCAVPRRATRGIGTELEARARPRPRAIAVRRVADRARARRSATPGRGPWSPCSRRDSFRSRHCGAERAASSSSCAGISGRHEIVHAACLKAWARAPVAGAAPGARSLGLDGRTLLLAPRPEALRLRRDAWSRLDGADDLRVDGLRGERCPLRLVRSRALRLRRRLPRGRPRAPREARRRPTEGERAARGRRPPDRRETAPARGPAAPADPRLRQPASERRGSLRAGAREGATLDREPGSVAGRRATRPAWIGGRHAVDAPAARTATSAPTGASPRLDRRQRRDRRVRSAPPRAGGTPSSSSRSRATASGSRSSRSRRRARPRPSRAAGRASPRRRSRRARSRSRRADGRRCASRTSTTSSRSRIEGAEPICCGYAENAFEENDRLKEGGPSARARALRRASGILRLPRAPDPARLLLHGSRIPRHDGARGPRPGRVLRPRGQLGDEPAQPRVGADPRAWIVGRPIAVVWPPSRIRKLPAAVPGPCSR
jgi:hypothetical protein